MTSLQDYLKHIFGIPVLLFLLLISQFLHQYRYICDRLKYQWVKYLILTQILQLFLVNLLSVLRTWPLNFLRAFEISETNATYLRILRQKRPGREFLS